MAEPLSKRIREACNIATDAPFQIFAVEVEELEARMAASQTALQEIAAFKDKTLIASPKNCEDYCRGYSVGANRAFRECAALVELALSPDAGATPPSDGITDTRNSAALADFTAYCRANPEQRFWQALKNWSGWGKILAAYTRQDWDWMYYKDTYGWEGKGLPQPMKRTAPTAAEKERAIENGKALGNL